MAASFKIKFGKKASSSVESDKNADNVSVASSSSSSSATTTSVHAPLATTDSTMPKKHKPLFGRMSKKLAKMTKFGREDDAEEENWRSQIEDLEKRLEEVEREKQSAEKQLEVRGRECEERGKEVSSQSVRIGDLAERLQRAERQLECRESEHARRMTELESVQREELTRLRMSDEMDLDAKIAELEALYRVQMEELSAKCVVAMTGLSQLNEPLAHPGETGDQHSTPNGPLDYAKADDVQLDQQERVLLEEQLEQMRNENEVCLREKEDLEEKMAGLHVVIDENSQAIVSLSVQIAELRDELQNEQEKKRQVETQMLDLQIENKKQMEEEMVLKTDAISSLEEKIRGQETSIEGVSRELKELETKMENVKDEIQTSDKRHKRVIEEKDKEFEAMQNLYTKTLEERKVMQTKYEEEFERLRNCHQEGEHQMMEDFEWKLREIQKTSKMKQDELKSLQVKLKGEYEELVNKKDVQAENLSKQIEDNDDKINITETELRQLRGFTDELQKNVKVATNQVEQMRQLEIRFREELRDTRAHLVESKESVNQLQKELSDTKASCERRLKAKDVNLKKTFDEQMQIVTQQWNIKLDKEMKKRTEDLEIKYNNLKLSALEELSNQKDQEIAGLLKKCEFKSNEYNKQLATLTSQLELRERQLTDEIELVKMTSNLKITESQKLMDMKNEQQQKKDFELKCKEKQIEELQMQLAVHRTTLELIKEEAAKQTESEIQRFKTQHEQQIENVNNEWEEKLKNALEAQSQSHKTQIHNARIELEKLMQLSKSKEHDQQECIVELKEAVQQREQSIKRLNEEMQRLQKGLSKMSQELEFHGREILRVKNEASRQLRATPDGTFNHVKHTEDMTAIKHLREAVLDKDRMVKKLQEEKKVLCKQLQNHMTNYKRLSASQPIVNSTASLNEANKVTKRNKRSKECPNRLSAPVILAHFDRSSTNNVNGGEDIKKTISA